MKRAKVLNDGHGRRYLSRCAAGSSHQGIRTGGDDDHEDQDFANNLMEVNENDTPSSEGCHRDRRFPAQGGNRKGNRTWNWMRGLRPRTLRQ